MRFRNAPKWSRLVLTVMFIGGALGLALVVRARASVLFAQTVPTRTPRYTLPPPPSPTSTGTPVTPAPPGPTADLTTPPAPQPTPPRTAIPSPGASSLDIHKEVSVQAVLPGQPIQYTIWVTNTGPIVATNVILRDLFDPMLELLRVSASQGTAEVKAQALVLNLGMLEPGQVALTLIDARVSQQARSGRIILNQASVYCDGGQASSNTVAVGLPPYKLPATGASRRQP